jgi:hypothetical protein
MSVSDWIASNWIEIFGALSGIIYVFLEIRQNIWLWPVGIVTSAVYIVVFFASKFYADMSLQEYYLIMSCIGWYWWLRAQGTGHRAKGTGHRAQGTGTGLRTRGTGHRAQGSERRARGTGRRAQGAGRRARGTGCRVRGTSGDEVKTVNRFSACSSVHFVVYRYLVHPVEVYRFTCAGMGFLHNITVGNSHLDACKKDI